MGNGAAYDWQNILNRITSTTLRQTLTGKASPSADELRAAIKTLYASEGIKIFISAFGAADHPMGNGADAVTTGNALAAYADTFQYDGVDVDWEEAFFGKFAAGAGGEQWLCTLTNTLRNALPSEKEISHAPQAPYFMGSTLNQYPDGGYASVHKECGDKIDFYNVQFYNQGGSTYNDYSSLFVSSIGWSQNIAVYQIMDGASPENVQIPASKLVVGKHTNGDGSSFIDGASLKSVFDEALTAGRWSAGFMTWQFYKELYPASGTPLIDDVITANWPELDGTPTPTTPATPSPVTSATPSPVTPVTPAPVTPSPTSPSPTSSDPIDTENYHGASEWYFAANLNGVAYGFDVTKFEIELANGNWFECGTCTDSTSLYTCSVDTVIALPFNVRLYASHADGDAMITSTPNAITSFEYGIVHDFGSNFAD